MRRSSAPITQPPPIRSHFLGPPPRNKLRSPRSVTTLVDGRHVYGRPSSILSASQSSLGLNSQIGLPPSANNSNSNLPGLLSGRTQQPSSLLNSNPIQTLPRAKKSGFFSKLFGFGKPKYQEPVAQSPTRRPQKPSAPRPVSVMSTASFDSYASSSTLRPRAVLVKKQPIYQTKSHSVVARPGGPPPRQNHTRSHSEPQPTLPRVTTPMLSPIPEDSINYNAPNHAPSSNIPNYPNIDDMISSRNPAHSARPISDPTGQLIGSSHTQGLTPTNHTRQVSTGIYHGQFPSYTNRGYPGTQDFRNKPSVTTPAPIPCTVCKQNPQRINPTTGETSPYCSGVCQAAVTPATPQPQSRPQLQPQLQPQPQLQSQSQPQLQSPLQPQSQPPLQPQQVACSYPGCTRPAVMYPADHYWNYCTEEHERYARKGCISCRKVDDSGTHLCKRCKESFKQRAPAIILVPMDHDAFWQVVDKFSESWADPTQSPIFQAARVYKVVLSQTRRDLYLGYRDTLEYYGRFTMKGKSEGNERTLWHGTRRGCYLGEKGQNTPCQIPRCSLCSVIRGQSGTDKLATDTPAGRFGRGIYAFTKASKASDHSINDKNIDTPWVTLLLSKVATGHECVMRHDNTTLTSPPQGYDSIIGEVRGRLNYDELVVYTNDAIRPTWLVMYQRT